ncbi:uncharacterized protein [Nicotiana tomentosiformis]|uniref:uncharacterized protein n=1 Tax=Nicotiana tomentosiformis TaxID=4098 RepID=UPI00388C6325
MAKTSKTVPQKEAASSPQPAGGEDAAEPRPEEFVLFLIPIFPFVGLGKYVAMRPSFGDEEVPTPKLVKENKRKDASVLHHEAFLRIREEHEAEVRNLTKKSDSYKFLSEKLRVDLAAARDEHEEMAEKVRQRLEQIGRLNSQVDELMAKGEKFKENMDTLASRKEVVQAQLESVEAKLRDAKENASVQIERVKELQNRLDLATFDKASLANELQMARSKVTEANKRADANVAQFKIDVEVNQTKSMVEHAKWQARREALEEVSAQVFDVEAEIEIAKVEENKA